MAEKITSFLQQGWKRLKHPRISWVVLGVILLLTGVVRLRLLDMPLERDEGEYAYAGQLILQGVAPYQEVFNMKLPGTYVAYAVIMAVFGQTPSGIHFGLLLLNLASAVLVFLLGRKFLDEVAGVGGALAFSLMTLSPGVLGLAAHATHFVAFFALLGAYMLASCGQQILANLPSRRPPTTRPSYPPAWKIFVAGVFLGLAFLMKQHGVFFCGFGVLYFGFVLFYQRYLIREWCRENRITPDQAKALVEKPEVRSQRSEVGSQKSQVGGPRPSLPTLNSQLSTVPKRLSHFAAGKLKQRQQVPEAVDKTPNPNGGESGFNGPAVTPELKSPVPGLQSPGFPSPASVHPQIPASCSWFIMVPLLAGLAVPYLVTCLVLLAAGALPEFWFWTVTYASEYASAVSFDSGVHMLRTVLGVVTGPDLPFWVLPWAGVVVIWWDSRLPVGNRVLLVILLACSLGSVVLGFYFRPHYFITLIPALALLSGLALSRGIQLFRRDAGIELLLSLPLIVLFIAGAGASLIGNGAVWFGMSSKEAIRASYHSTLFNEAVSVGQFLRENVPAGERIAVLGSEPELFVYSRRRSVSGHIYMYPLMETHAFAERMQGDFIREIEEKKPNWFVFVDDNYSWLTATESHSRLWDWWQGYWPTSLGIIATYKIEEGGEDDSMEKPVAGQVAPRKTIMVLQRKLDAK